VTITRNQWLQIIGIVFGAIVASSALWTQLFGATTAQTIISVTGFLTTVLSGITYVLTGQGQQIRDVANMPGVDTITVNSSANKTLATAAVDQSQDKVVPSAAAANTVQATAKGN
jgi:hypothetical protein